MKQSLRLHQSRRLKNTLITLLLLGVFIALANLSSRYSLQTDISNNASNTLSTASLDLLGSLPDPITITAYIKQGLPIRAQIGQLVDRYKRSKANISLVFIDPDLEPENLTLIRGSLEIKLRLETMPNPNKSPIIPKLTYRGKRFNLRLSP